MLLKGVIWEAYAPACYDVGPNDAGRERIGCGANLLDHPWRYSIGSQLNGFQLDDFSAHSQASGLYHYHSTPQALYEIDCRGEAESPVIGCYAGTPSDTFGSAAGRAVLTNATTMPGPSRVGSEVPLSRTRGRARQR